MYVVKYSKNKSNDKRINVSVGEFEVYADSEDETRKILKKEMPDLTIDEIKYVEDNDV